MHFASKINRNPCKSSFSFSRMLHIAAQTCPELSHTASCAEGRRLARLEFFSHKPLQKLAVSKRLHAGRVFLERRLTSFP
jgi:hypothetical protein